MVGPSCVVLHACVIIWSVCGSHALDLLKPPSGPASVPPPRPEVQCRCARYPNQTLCLWSEPSGQSAPTSYIATYRERNDWSVIKYCRLFPPGSSSSALSSSSSEKLWHCQLDHLKLYTDYIVNVTSISPLGNTTQLTSFMVEDIVKPDTPVEVKVFPGSRLAVEWSPPPTWSNLDIFPLKYRLRYSWFHHRGNKTMHKDLGTHESTRVYLGPMAPRSYLFQVCAMELLDLGECSEWSSPVEVLIAKKH